MFKDSQLATAEPATSDAMPRVNARPELTRRQWLKRTVRTVAACGLAAGAYAYWIEPFWVEFVEKHLPIANLPPQWHGRTLVQISDIHVGHRVSDEFLLGTFKQIADREPDIVVFTGDLISLSPDGVPPYDQLRHVLNHLPRGKLATLGVLGNHDYGRRWSERSVAARLTDLSRDCGMRVLRNKTASVDGLDIIGIDDLVAGHCDGAAALASSRAAARLVLCHNPDAADKPFWGDYRGWILAGHTHGGQCKPPCLAPPVLPVENPRYTAGEIDLYDGRTMYINRGLGHLQRVRFNVRPEVTVFRLSATA